MTLFDKWYKAYPRKKAPGQARKAFERINPDEAMTEKMIVAIQLQAKEREVRQQRGLFNPEWKYPATWLNAECWDDEVDLDVMPETKTSIEEIAKQKGLEARVGETTKQFELRVLQTRH